MAEPLLIVNLNKPKGWTSFDAVKLLRGRLRIRKAGHLGTLDPFATGALPIFLGKATRLIPLFNTTDKVYRATLRLGLRTDTFDEEGTLLQERDASSVSEAKVRESASHFTGQLEQLTPIYSAVKVQGVPSYRLARQGKPVERKTRTVQVYRLEVLRIALPEVEFEVHCSSGTYIRTLADDWGEHLGVGAHLTALHRVACGPWFHEGNAVQVEDVRAQGEELRGLDPVALLSHLPTLTVDAPEVERLRQGQALTVDPEQLSPWPPKETEAGVPAKVVGSLQNLIAVGSLMWKDTRLTFQPERVLL